MSEEKQTTPKTISRREFLKDAGIVVGGTAVGSAFFLSACGKEVEVTKTVTTTAPGTTSTKTVTTTAGGSTQTITKYTCPVCNQEFTSLDALKTHFDEVHDNGTASDTVKLIVNGYEYEVQVEPNWALRDVLRQKIGLTSVKDFCNGYGACGSCCVLMNGRPVLSCLVLAIECDGAVIETTEGIADENHPLIEAYIMNYCAQCGYCTPGFIVTAKAMLDKNSDPTEDDIKEALSGNLCRCGTYQTHVTAILEAAGKLKEIR